MAHLNSMRPLCDIRPDQQHAQFEITRRISRSVIKQFTDMQGGAD